MHLTMYGMNLPDVINEIMADNLLIIVGAEKVPPDVYELADWNIAVGNQPHSEVAALAVTLDRINTLSGRDALKEEFTGGELNIVPKRRGKEVKSR